MARKKRPGRSSVAGSKADFSPPNATRRREIVEKILVQLQPWKRRRREVSITAQVNYNVNHLLGRYPPGVQRPSRKDYRTHAKQLDSALTKVETLLLSASGRLAWSLFYPLAPFGRHHQPLWEIERTRKKHIDTFFAELRRFRSVCAQAVSPGFGNHPNYDFLKASCARTARGLMLDMSERKITGTKDDAFRAITSLFYEAVSGQQGADLKRACDSVLREIRERYGPTP
jgi:hypothetical protein